MSRHLKWLERLRDVFRAIEAHAHGAPVYRQHAFRFRTTNPRDIGSFYEGTDPAINTNVTTPSLTGNWEVRIRIEIEETSGNAGTISPTLYYSLNGGTYTRVNASSSVLRPKSNAFYSDNSSTTSLVTGTGSSTRNFTNGSSDTADGVTSDVSFTGNQHTELDFSLDVINADVSNGDTIDLRVRNGTTDLDVYGITPRITVSKPAATRTQEAFRIRPDGTALNTDGGWSAAQNTDVSLEAEQTIRLRFRVKNTVASSNTGYQLRYSRNGGAYTALPVQATPVGTGVTPAAIESTISTGFTDDDAITSALLTGGTGTFVNGRADEASNTTSAISLAVDQYTELEFAVRIRKFYWSGSAVVENVDGTTFDFRVYTSAGAALTSYSVTPRITVDSAGLVGGTWPEAPHHLGPIVDTNGNMYFFMESWEDKVSGGWVLALKSTDGGLTWTAQDIADGPGASAGTDDWEGASVVQDNQVTGRVFLFSHHSTTVEKHIFFTSDHATTPDQWGTVGTVVDTFGAVLNSQQWVAATIRSDGDLILLYNEGTATDNLTSYTVSTDGGTNWSAPANLDGTTGRSIYNAWPVMAESDLCYIFYHDNDTPTTDTAHVFYKTLTSAGVLTADGSRVQVSTNNLGGGAGQRGAILGGAYYDDGGVEVVTVVWVDSNQATPVAVSRALRDGALQSIKTVSGVGVAEGGLSGSNQYVGSVAVDTTAKTLHVLYADETTIDVFHDSEVDDGGWGTDTEVEDGVDALWVRSNVVTRSGAKYLGYVYDNGTGATAGGQGPVYYSELALAAPPATKTHTTDLIRRATATRAHTTDLILRATVVRSHSTDLVLRATETQAHTTDLVLRATETRTHTTDLVVLATEAVTHTTDLHVAARTTRTHTTDLIRRATATRTHTTDLVVLATEAVTHTTDLVVLATEAVTHTTDLVLRATATRSHTTDLVLRATATRTHTTDLVLDAGLATETRTHTTDLILRATETLDHTSDLILRGVGTRAHTSDLILRATETRDHTTDLILQATEVQAHTTDLILRATTTQAHTTDLVLRATTTQAHTTDLVLRATATRSHTTDLVLRATEVLPHTSDLIVVARNTATHTTDLIRRATETRTHTTDLRTVGANNLLHSTDLILLGTETQTHTTDLLVATRVTTSHTTDAVLRRTESRTHTTDALLRATVVRSHSTDLVLRATETQAHTTDLVLRATETRTHTTDAVLQATEALVHTTDLAVSAAGTPDHTTDLILRATETRAHTTDLFLVDRVLAAHTTDAVLRATETRTHTTDLLTTTAGAETHTTDLILLGTASSTHTTDLVVVEVNQASHTTDVALRIRPPAWITATAVSSTRIDVEWESVPDADAYDLERDSVIIAEKIVATTYQDTGRTPGTTYTYRVRSARLL